MNLIKLSKIWLLLVGIALAFSALYLYYTLYPGKVSPEAFKYFTPAEIDKSREYHRTSRLIYISSFLSTSLFLLWFTLGSGAIKLSRFTEKISSGRYYISAVLFFIFFWLMLNALSLPFALYSHIIDVKWGFSIQNMTSWWQDYLKSSLLEIAISGASTLLFFYAINRWRNWWWVAAWIFLSIMLFVQNLIWPYLIAPLFNKFTPVEDPSILQMVEDISKNAGIHIDNVQVMDASRRTTQANAYFYGIGKNNKIVLYDTLLKKYPQDEIKAVIAHEAAHWKENHVLKSLLLGSVSIFIALFLLHQLLKTTITWPYGKNLPIAALAVVYLFAFLISFDASPLQNYISRQMERQADILSVSYLHDKNSAIKLQVDLSKKDLLDVDPPSFIEWFSYTHPSTLHRIQTIQAAKILSQK
ncbi:M48 family metallopeptidase [Caldanaerobius polysaccharolyticus]|uniref:M48 family metallopeptidase n=1 Tax=Caldanaerobius polysaccharolyticus TaxID=44256 RepID=UPI0004792C52|nr:M48 family metallopeptidase [Caldanaerobius polysaccharolyticus]